MQSPPSSGRANTPETTAESQGDTVKRISRSAMGVVAVTAAITLAATTANAAVPTDTSELREAVTADAIMGHLDGALQKIADNNGDTRQRDARVQRVYGLHRGPAEGRGLQVTSRTSSSTRSTNWRRPYSSGRLPRPGPYVQGEDFYTAEYSGSGNVTAPLQAVDLVMPPGATASTSNSGCETADFADFTRGNIALVQRGTCDFSVKAENAYDAGAAA